MSAQGSFFDSPPDLARDVRSPRPGRARATHPDTSHAAARAVSVTAANHRGRILLALCQEAMTSEALHSATGGRAPHVCHTRASELQELGLVKLTDEKRTISTGREAHVWRVTDKGREVAAHLTEVAA